MRGSVKGQTLHLLNESGINCIGQSKFSAKDGARMTLAEEGRSGTSSAIAEKTGIHSFGTRDTYLDKWQELARFCKEEFRIKDLEKLTTEHVQQFLAYKIEMGVSYSHWSGNAAAFAKLENALNAYSAKFTARVSAGTYQRLDKHIFEHGNMKVSADAYRSSLKASAQASGQNYNGSHGLRWNFAKERFSELQKSGIGYEKALGMVSDDMGHNRIEISEHYLGLK